MPGHGTTPGSYAELLADLRTRRLARRLLELDDQLEARAAGRALFGDEEELSLRRDRDAVLARLARAAAKLPAGDALRAAATETCAADPARTADRTRYSAAAGRLEAVLRAGRARR